MGLKDTERNFGGVNKLGVNMGLRLVDFSLMFCSVFPLFMLPLEKSSAFLRPRSFPP